MARIVISGYYGFGNTGDEAVLSGIVETFKQVGLSAEFTVISSDPQRTMREHRDVRAIPRSNILGHFRALKSSDLYISGGGSLFQDATSARSPYYYLVGLHLARIARCRTMIYAQGIGPLIRPSIRKAVAKAFNRVDMLTVRDTGSEKLLKEIGVTRDIHVCADPAFLVEPDFQTTDMIIEKAGLSGERLIGISLRPWPASMDWINKAARIIQDLCSEVGAKAVFIPMQEPADSQIGNGQALGHGADPAVAKGLLARCEMVVGMRLHSLIFAVGAGVPCVPIAYDPKVSSFARDAGLGESIVIGDDQAAIAGIMRSAWDNRQASADKLAANFINLKKQALCCGALAAQVLENTEH